MLAWDLKHAKHLEFLISIDARERLDTRPALWPENYHAMHAWGVLSPKRDVGWGVGPLTLPQIESYIRIFRPYNTLEDNDELIHKLEVLDSEFRRYHSKQKPPSNQNQNRRGGYKVTSGGPGSG